MYVQKREESLSPASSVTHASAVSLWAHHARTAVIFPYPRAPQPTSAQRPRPHRGLGITLGRCTIPARSRGAASLASASGGSSSAGRRFEDKSSAPDTVYRLAIVHQLPVHRTPGSLVPAEKRPDSGDASDRRQSKARRAVRAPCLTRQRPTLAGQSLGQVFRFASEASSPESVSAIASDLLGRDELLASCSSGLLT